MSFIGLDPMVLAYLAGIIDGEGSIGVHRIARKDRGTYNYRLDVVVAMQSQEPMFLFQETFVGTSKVRHADKAWRISWTSHRAAAVLEALEPYLRVKKAQSQLARMFQSRMRNPARFGPRWTPEEMSTNEMFARLINELNRRDSNVYHGRSARSVGDILAELERMVP